MKLNSIPAQLTSLKYVTRQLRHIWPSEALVVVSDDV
jgi:hypothetical protein